MKILILYARQYINISTVAEHVSSFERYSRHSIEYANACNENLLGAAPVRCDRNALDGYDAVVLHYTTLLMLNDHLSIHWIEAIRRFKGRRVLFIQDEYTGTNVLRAWMDDLQFDLVFTCVPAPYVHLVYPPARFPNTRFVSVLTGYVPESLVGRDTKPTVARSVIVGYRGREGAIQYGALVEQKIVIGQRMKDECQRRGIPHDIEWKEWRRIYGSAWYDFVASSKVTLGSESGSNVFDDDGSIARALTALKSESPATYEVDARRFVAKYEGATGVRMNQISPRIFEAVALRTGLVLFRGEYSGVVEPDTHYIPIEHDFSNVDEVFERIADDRAVQAMVDRTYDHVVGSGRWSYRNAVAEFDREVENAALSMGRPQFRPWPRTSALTAVTGSPTRRLLPSRRAARGGHYVLCPGPGDAMHVSSLSLDSRLTLRVTTLGLSKCGRARRIIHVTMTEFDFASGTSRTVESETLTVLVTDRRDT